MTAKGTFDVNLKPQDGELDKQAPGLGRMAIDKTFSGVLEGRSLGQMLTGMTDVKGSAGYVAIERFSGKLDGKAGSFILQHNGSMSGGEQQLTITVVPDSGTEELRGINGHMLIDIRDGSHFYTFEYEL